MWECITRSVPYPTLPGVEVAHKVCYENMNPGIPEKGCRRVYKKIMAAVSQSFRETKWEE